MIKKRLLVITVVTPNIFTLVLAKKYLIFFSFLYHNIKLFTANNQFRIPLSWILRLQKPDNLFFFLVTFFFPLFIFGPTLMFMLHNIFPQYFFLSHTYFIFTAFKLLYFFLEPKNAQTFAVLFTRTS